MTSAATKVSQLNPQVYIAGGNVHINGFVETSPAVVQVVSAADDPVAATHRIMLLGAQVHAVADNTTTAVDLSETVARLTASVEGTVDTAVHGISDAAKQLLDEESGELPRMLDSFSQRFASLLGESFDPDSKKSLVSKFETVMVAAADEQTRRLNRALDPHSPDSLLGRLRTELISTMKEETSDVGKQVAELREVITSAAAAADATKTMFDKTVLKGFKFEDALHELVMAQAVHYGDVAHQVGKEYGSAGTLAGDELVIVNPEDTRGASVAAVWEAKTRRVGLRKMLDELDGAMTNRNAVVGVAVFGDATTAPVKVPFAQFGDKAVLVLDKENPDEGAVRLAYMWARWVARRKLGESDASIDLTRVETLIDDATRTLEHGKQVRKCHTMARKGIDEAGAHLDTMTREFDAVLSALRQELEKAE
jgi:hypothetical protein